MLWENPTTRRLVLVGVINYGRGCAASDPGVNARVGSYLGWVVNQAQGKFTLINFFSFIIFISILFFQYKKVVFNKKNNIKYKINLFQ